MKVKQLTTLLLVSTAALNMGCFNDTDSFGKVSGSSENASAYSQKSKNWTPLKKSHTVKFGDTIQTAANPLSIVFRKNCKLTIEPNSKVIILDSSDKKNHFIFPIIFSGGILSELKHKKPGDFQYIVYSPVSYIQSQGTCFYVSYNPSNGTSDVYVYDGNVIVYNSTDFSNPVELTPGYTTTVVYTNAPLKPVKLKYNQFRKIGYLFTPEDCSEYAVIFGFPSIPIPVPVMVQPQVQVVNEPVKETVIYKEARIPPPRKNVSVSVNINANGGFPLPPVPFIPQPVPLPHGRVVHHPPVPVFAPVPVVPVPVPGPMMPPAPGFGMHGGRHHGPMMAPVPGPRHAPVPPAPGFGMHGPHHGPMMGPVPGPRPVHHRSHGNNNNGQNQNWQQGNNNNNQNDQQQQQQPQRHRPHGPFPPPPFGR